ncbi:hypothetical protein M0802_009921 [Mischocyttarus mexicanus]|nr:hypothetical protein M0802_009921 [Mischocyttarus mexicanus]
MVVVGNSFNSSSINGGGGGGGNGGGGDGGGSNNERKAFSWPTLTPSSTPIPTPPMGKQQHHRRRDYIT